MNLSSTQLYFRLLNYVKPYWRIFAISLLGMIVVASTEPLVPALMKPMLDGTFVHKDQAMMYCHVCRNAGNQLGRQQAGDGLAQ
jgi:subfamily B ATP-binding cassette protein MsbA